MMTVIYYTSSREEEKFEQRVIENLKKSIGDLPVISVSQKPLDFGRNIDVGDIGVGVISMLQQILIGAEIAQTPFVTFGESDVLYPPDYFTFVPEREDTFYYTNNFYVHWVNHYSFWPKRRSEISSIVGRKYLIDTVSTLLEMKFKYMSRAILRLRLKHEFFDTSPVVSLKTGNGMNARSPHGKIPVHEVPVWGTGVDILKNYVE